MKSLLKLMNFIKKLKKLTLLSRRIQAKVVVTNEECELVPRDVKEGHFAVLAGNGEGKKRFIVGLHHLRNPEFLRLLDEAREEYGFRHHRLLALPCLPEELHKILEGDIYVKD